MSPGTLQHAFVDYYHTTLLFVQYKFLVNVQNLPTVPFQKSCKMYRITKKFRLTVLLKSHIKYIVLKKSYKIYRITKNLDDVVANALVLLQNKP